MAVRGSCDSCSIVMASSFPFAEQLPDHTGSSRGGELIKADSRAAPPT